MLLTVLSSFSFLSVGAYIIDDANSTVQYAPPQAWRHSTNVSGSDLDDARVFNATE